MTPEQLEVMEINPSLRFKGYTKVEPLLFGERFTKGEFMIKRMLFNKETTWDSFALFLAKNREVIINDNILVDARVDDDDTIEFATFESTMKFGKKDFELQLDWSLGYYVVRLSNEHCEIGIFELTVPQDSDGELEIIVESSEGKIEDRNWEFTEEYLESTIQEPNGNFIKTYIYGDDYQGKFINDLMKMESTLKVWIRNVDKSLIYTK